MKEITPQNCGASQIACDIINETFLSLDGFEPLRRQMDASGGYDSLAFASSLARIADRCMKRRFEVLDPCKKSRDKKYKSHVGLSYLRRDKKLFSFQLLYEGKAHATIDIADGSIVNELLSEELKPRLAAIKRLAMAYYDRANAQHEQQIPY